MPSQLDDSLPAYTAAFPYFQENEAASQWFTRRVAQTLASSQARSLLSLGLGHQIVAAGFIKTLAEKLDHYTIVEGSAALVEQFKAEHVVPANVEVAHALFEAYQPVRQYDALEIGFVLEHVDDPGLILEKYAPCLRPGGSLFLAVPNAATLHRRFGHAAGLLDNIYQLSSADLALGHKRYFDVNSFTKLVLSAGYQIRRLEGIYMKPLTTVQLDALSLPPAVYQAFFEVGIHYPELCHAIYIEATR